ncbi:MAG: flagellar filament capping protein FliD [Burkholderiales bacterium]|jgi:flagellar hook-associated protein 2|nr:flagellar filament capping protein FliD [Burkholderiales bacterium]
MALSSPGIGSGIDVNSIVSQLMTIERRPLDLLNRKEASFQSQISALGTVRSALGSLQSSATALANPARFQTRVVGSSDTTVLTGSATSTAEAGSYTVNVTQLAQGQSVVAAGQTSTTAAIGTGASTTLRFDFGSITGGTLAGGVYSGATFTQDANRASRSVTIDATNNSLAGIKDAINAANIGVRASIVGDGSATPFRLALQSTTAGASSSLRIAVTGDAAIDALLGYDPAGTQNLVQTQAGQDAVAAVNGLTVTSSTNVLAGVIGGVTLNLVKAGTSTVTVSRNTNDVTQLVQGFVKAYNDLDKTLSELSAADPSTGSRGPLNGDFAVRSIQSQVRAALGSAVSTTGGISTLSQVGVTFQKDGSLALDTTKLSAALSGNADGVAEFFASATRATDSLVRPVTQTSATRTGNYALAVSQIATQGRLVGAGAADTTITAGVDDTLSITVDGITASIALTPGTYTQTSLVGMLQAAINGASTLSTAGVAVNVSQAGGVVTITSRRFGSASNVSASGNAASDLFGGVPTATAGVDVAGSFNGTAGTGRGQALSGASGSATQGLVVDITGGATGDRGVVTVGGGFASSLGRVLDNLLSTSGPIASRTDGINRSIADIGSQREVLSRRLTDVEARYRAQFTRLDELIGRMQTTSNFLTQQLARLPSAGN